MQMKRADIRKFQVRDFLAQRMWSTPLKWHLVRGPSWSVPETSRHHEPLMRRWRLER